jgi:glyoxylase I family protein
MKFTVEHLGLPSKDTVALKDWYVRVLDGSVLFENGQTPPAFFVEISGLMLEIYPAGASVADTGNNAVAGFRHLAIRVEAIDPAREELTKKGVTFTEPIKPAGGGGRVQFFKDLDGNLLHLLERPAGSIFNR